MMTRLAAAAAAAAEDEDLGNKSAVVDSAAVHFSGQEFFAPRLNFCPWLNCLAENLLPKNVASVCTQQQSECGFRKTPCCRRRRLGQ